MKKRWLFVLFLWVYSGCSNDARPITDETNVTTIQIALQSRLKLLRSFILDEKKYQIGRIFPGQNFVSPDGDIYVNDIENLVYCIFDSLGNFKRILGKKGKGPSELTMPVSISMDPNNRIYVFDEAQFKTVVYDKNNQYITEYKFNKCYPRTGNIQFTKSDTLITLYCATKDNFYEGIELFHQIDSNLQIIRSIAIDYPSEYKELELGNFTFHDWVADDEAIYVLHQAFPEIYKHDRNGKLLAILPMTQAINFKRINEKQLETIDLIELRRFLSKYSFAAGIFLLRNDLLFVLTFHQTLPSNLNNPFSSSREFRTFYYNIVTTNGEEIMPTDSHLPGEILYVTNTGKVYILLSDEPENRKIGVYEIVLEEI